MTDDRDNDATTMPPGATLLRHKTQLDSLALPSVR